MGQVVQDRSSTSQALGLRRREESLVRLRVA
jgi:hypothetical protein